jgi:DNA/RNA endonuclease G (NUC1)
VIRESADPQQPNVLAFLYPQISARYYARRPYPHQNYLVTVDLLEWLTGLDFFSNLPEDKQGVLEKQQHQWLWPVADDDFLRTCD